MKRYFYLTIHFSPKYEGSVLTEQPDGMFWDCQTGEQYQKRLLYDFGWGQESGFELLPQLPFRELIQLVEQPQPLPVRKRFGKYSAEQVLKADIWRSNLYGAAAVIMQDHVKEFVAFLSEKANTDYFSDPAKRDNFKCFSFDSEKTRQEGKCPGGVLTRSYEDILRDDPDRERIGPTIVRKIYG